MNLKELYVYLKYRDRCFMNARSLKGEITRKYKGVDTHEIYIKIVSYQINKYGETLTVRVKPHKAKTERKVS